EQPEAAHFIYLYGRLLDNDAQKRTYFYRAIKADSALFNAQFDLAKIHYYAGEYNEAIARFQKTARLRPGSAQVANLLGLAYYHSGYPNQAIVEYQKAIANEPANSEIYLNLGIAYYYTDQADLAIKTYLDADRQAEWHDDRHALYHSLDMAYRKTGEIDKAAGAYRKALGLMPTYTEAQISLGTLALYQENYADAISAFDRAIGTPLETADLHMRLGLAHFNSQSYAGAVLHFRQTIERDTTRIQAYHYLGRAHDMNKQPDEALEALEMYLLKEAGRENRAQAAEARKLIADIKKERVIDFLK
ncbi:MAG: tetratricopeptide repeat protein, partial [bacterium]|nr:tetratricopeptide repeat protein [bacterium]